ncbi:MAG: hypothetical protein ACXAB5_01565 [Candidatus Thorarchaeota archaeon]|jgi:hypothetical protein
MKETREILEDFLLMEKSEYELVELASTVSATKPVEKKPDNGSTNVLTGSEASEEIDDLESYEPTEKIEIEAADVKDCFEKKKKKRNYIEFRPDYVAA